MSRSALALMGALFLTCCAAQANSQDTPPYRFEFPAKIGGAAHVTAAERATVNLSRAGKARAAMLRSMDVIGARVSLPYSPDYMACAAQSETRWTCATKTHGYSLTARVYIPADRALVITRVFVKYRGTGIASAWAAQRGATYCKTIRGASYWRGGFTRSEQISAAYAMGNLWAARDSRVRYPLDYTGVRLTSSSYTGTITSTTAGLRTIRARFRYDRAATNIGCVTVIR